MPRFPSAGNCKLFINTLSNPDGIYRGKTVTILSSLPRSSIELLIKTTTPSTYLTSVPSHAPTMQFAGFVPWICLLAAVMPTSCHPAPGICLFFFFFISLTTVFWPAGHMRPVSSPYKLGPRAACILNWPNNDQY